MAGNKWVEIRFNSQCVIKALEHMHSMGYIHGDVKPKVVVYKRIYIPFTYLFKIIYCYLVINVEKYVNTLII